MALLSFLADHPELAVWVVGLVVIQVEAVRRDVKKNSELAEDVKRSVEALRVDVDDMDDRLTKVELKIL